VTSAGGHPLAGRWSLSSALQLGQWVNRKKVRLGSPVPGGSSWTCAAGTSCGCLTTNQAGTGYLWSHSRTLVVTKRKG
jgi:hypothetical protein